MCILCAGDFSEVAIKVFSLNLATPINLFSGYRSKDTKLVYFVEARRAETKLLSS